MSIFSRKLGHAIALAALCLGAPAVHAQVALPLNYWIPGGPFGFGSGLTDVHGFESYTSFPSLDLSSAGGDRFSATQMGNWFISTRSGTAGLGVSSLGVSSFGFSQADTLGSIGTVNYQSTNFAYNFKDETGASPLRIFGGLDTVNYNTTIGNPFSAFTSQTNTATAYRAHAGVEFQAAPNVSLSLEAGYLQR
jgi:opacity protein-like surface antigen